MQLLLVQTGWSVPTICGCYLLRSASKAELLSSLSFLLNVENWVLHSPLRSRGAEQIASLHFFCRGTGANALFFCSEYCKFQGRKSFLCSQISLVQSICLLHECCRALLPSFPWLLLFAPFSSRLRVIFNWRADKEMNLGSTVSANDLSLMR